MKQSIISLLLTLTLTSAEHEHEGYSPYFANGPPGLVDLGEHLDPKQEYKVEHPAGLIFGHGFLDGIHSSDDHKGLESFKVGKLEYVANTNLLSFEKELEAPETPKPIITAGQEYSPKYTNTPVQTYEVVEDNFEPKPVPKISVATPVLPAQSIGSGSLGVSKLGSGGYALGSGGLGYVNSRSLDFTKADSGAQSVSLDFGKADGGAQSVSFDFTKGGAESVSSDFGKADGGAHSVSFDFTKSGGFSDDSGFKPGGGIADFSSLFKER